MKRSTFFKTLLGGAIAAPIAASACIKGEPAAQSRNFKYLGTLPEDAGRVVSMIQYQSRFFIACENGIIEYTPDSK